ncbi:group I intron-associated PD-(D/E)XK endonuclease [Nonomuraea sp. NPDC049400]|uniref:group I intron-associated PD-(D/E)XK endonuclease n=1 Tax=Nonomuraea sp. NPDC049400 TaxID=3364352 RepID=UPI00378A036A
MSDEEFGQVVAAARSWADVLGQLGYSRRSEKAISRLKDRACELGLAVDHFRKTWGDEDLITAVTGATSWRGVSRALGIASEGGRQLKVLQQRAEALGLDVDHFTGSRRWSVTQLRQALEGETWRAVTHVLGVSNTSQSRATIRRRAAALGLATAHLDAGDIDHVDPEPNQGDLKHLRKAATTIAAAWFTLRGSVPSMPLEAQPYDLLVDMRGRIHRIQVKTCMVPSGEVTIAHRLAGTVKGALVPYSAADVDEFFILDGNLSIYLIPIDKVEGKLRISLRKYRRYCVGSASSLLD